MAINDAFPLEAAVTVSLPNHNLFAVFLHIRRYWPDAIHTNKFLK